MATRSGLGVVVRKAFANINPDLPHNGADFSGRNLNLSGVVECTYCPSHAGGFEVLKCRLSVSQRFEFKI